MVETDEVRFEILNFGHWNLFEIWNLKFVILVGSGPGQDHLKDGALHRFTGNFKAAAEIPYDFVADA